MNISAWCTRIIRVLFSLLLILVPLVLTPWNYELFEYNKMMITYALTTAIISAWIVKMISEKSIAITRTPLDIPIGLFFLSQLVSTLFSMDPHVSWMGYYSRFNGGMWSIITYILLYYAFVSNFVSRRATVASGKHAKPAKVTELAADQKHITTLLLVTLSTAGIVALYGILERLGIDKHLWVQDVQNRVFSSLGQPNWLAAYLVALIPVSLAFFLRSTQIKKLYYGILTLIFFTVLLFTRSRSGLVGLAIADVLFWAFLFTKLSKDRFLRLSALGIHTCFALIIFFNGSNISQIDKHFTLQGLTTQYKQSGAKTASAPQSTGPALETGGTESGTIRKFVWEGALSAWRSTTKTVLIGTGTETFAFAFYKFRPAGHNLTSEWDFLYNKAHNEYLNYLATTGIFGLGSYMVFVCLLVFWFIRSQKEKENLIALALFAGWASILITNFFGFSVVIVQLFLFLFPAIIFLLYSDETAPSIHEFVVPLRLPTWTPWAILFCGGMLVVRIALFWHADTLYASAYRDTRSGQYLTAKKSLETASLINPNEPNYHDEMATALAALAIGAYEQQQATAASDLAKQSLEENAKAISTSPLNVNFWKSKTKIYYSFSSLNPAFTAEAIKALEKAQELSPADPKILYNLAILSGRQGENAKAIELLKRAIMLKKNYHDAYYALYVFYTELKNPDSAKQILEEYIKTVDQNDEQFTKILREQVK